MAAPSAPCRRPADVWTRRSLIETNEPTIRRRTWSYVLLSLGLIVLAILASRADWESTSGAHTGFELAASLLAGAVGAFALVRYYSEKQLPYLLASIGFLGAAAFDAYHTVTSTEHFTRAATPALADITAWGWTVGRTFLAVMLAAAWWFPRQGMRPDRRTELAVFATSAAAIVGTLLALSVLPLPQAYYPGATVTRPYDLPAGVFFVIAFIGLLRLRRWKEDVFHHWLLLSLLVEAAVQLLFMPFADAPFTAQFAIAHGAKVAAYLLMLIGLVLSMHQLVKDAHARQTEVERLNERLTGEVARRAGAEANLVDQKSDLEAILEGMAEGVVLTDKDGRLVRLNRGAVKILGQEISGPPEQYMSEFELYDADQKTPMSFEMTGLALALKGEAVRDSLLWMKSAARPDGLFIRSNAQPLRDEAGDIDGAVVVFRDVTDEEISRRAAAEREERLQALVRTAPDAVVSMDPESHVIEFNPAAERLFGWPADEIIGESVTNLMPERFRPQHFAGVRRFLDTGEGPLIGNTIEITALHRNGEHVPIELSLSTWRTAGIPRFTAIIRGIQRRKEAEARLRESEQTYRAMVSEVQDYAIYMLDPSGRIQTWNEGAARMTGLEAEEVVGRDALEVFREDKSLAQALEEAKQGRGETNSWHTRKDGSRYYTTCVITSITDADGRLLGFTKIMNDQTAQLQAEERLRESEQTYRAMVSEVQDYAIFMLDPDGHIRTWNEGASRITGYAAEEAIGRHFGDFSAEEGTPQALLEQAKSGRAESEGWRVHKDGSQYYVSSIITAIRDTDGRLLGFTKIMHDQTAEREAEERLRKSEERYRILADNASDLIAIHTLDGGFRYASPAAVPLTGYTMEELKDRRIYDLVHPEDRVRLRRQHERLDESGTARETVRFMSKDGKVVWLESAMRWMPGQATGATEQILARYRDVTEQVQDRAALARSNQELQEFAFIASHDLKEPLRKVIAFGDRIQSQYAEQLGPGGTDYLDRMRSAAERMRRLLDDLLAYSRVATKAGEPVSVDMEEVAQTVVEDLSEAIADTKADIQIHPLPTIRGDPTQLRQALQNLVGNALKYHRDNEPPIVRLEGGQRDGEHWFSIEDNGIGFEMRYVDRIFRPFQRLHGRSEYSGSGMGLAIVRKIIERHNGKIDVDSEPGRGTKFTVHIPVTGPDDNGSQTTESEDHA